MDRMAVVGRGSARSEPFRLLRRLDFRPVPTFIAELHQRTGQDSGFAIVEKIDQPASMTDEAATKFVRLSRALPQLRHCNVTKVLDVLVAAKQVVVINEFVEGETYGELWRLSDLETTPISLELSLRVLLDALDGLQAIHELRDSAGSPLGLAHGEVTPWTVLVGDDGVSRLMHVFNVPWLDTRPAVARGYLAPELLAGDREATPAADIFGVGVMLWEAISRRKLFADPSIRTNDPTPAPTARVPREAFWAAPLAAVASRALSPDAQDRFESAAEMAERIRLTAGDRLCSDEQVSATLQQLAGKQIARRRAILLVDAPAADSEDYDEEEYGRLSELGPGDMLAELGEQEPSALALASLAPPALPPAASAQLPAAGASTRTPRKPSLSPKLRNRLLIIAIGVSLVLIAVVLWAMQGLSERPAASPGQAASGSSSAISTPRIVASPGSGLPAAASAQAAPEDASTQPDAPNPDAEVPEPSADSGKTVRSAPVWVAPRETPTTGAPVAPPEATPKRPASKKPYEPMGI